MSEPTFEIPTDFYKEIIKVFPIPAVDSVIRYDNGVLLGKRVRSPAKERYWTIGGRIRFGETPEESIVRHVEEETGLRAIIEKFIGVYSQWFDFGQYGYPTHYINLAYLMKPQVGKLRTDFQHSEFRVIRNLDDELSECCKQVIIDSEVFGQSSEKHKRTSFRDK